ncbi:hypothetical protein GCM10011617_28150 [Novosphingobium arvoryzae]|uniref:Uncharacterized protein n=1 Tax=Novosphingobium arvoryzae TaxID=1256514 RepID=A0A918VK90_9SPHN|nr:hypothetical protein GCM10011617_28150 [Novosphingobium arvoryzae]
MLALAALHVLQLAQPHLHPFRQAAGIDRIGRISTGTAGKIDQRGSAILGLLGRKHGVMDAPQIQERPI